ncbi:phospholipase DDHD1 isoform X6 [Lissotriton helveticus]
MSFTDGYLLGAEPGEKNGAWQPGEPGYHFTVYEEDGADERVSARLQEKRPPGDERQQQQPPLRHHHHHYCQFPLPSPGQLELCLGQPAFDFASEPCAPGEDEEEEEGAVPGEGCSLGLPERKRTRSTSSRHRYEIVTELGPEEVRWFYREDKKSWKPFIGYDSLRIELAYRQLWDQGGGKAPAKPEEGGEPSSPPGEEEAAEEAREGGLTLDVVPLDLLKIEPVCVRSGLYEVDVAGGECYPVYWNQADKIPVMRGQWFVDGTWQPLEEDESNLIEQEHLNSFRGQQMQDTFDLEIAKPLDHKDAVHSLKLSRSHVDWHSVDEVYLYSDATTSKIARSVTQKLGFSKASSSGTRLHRGYVEEATLEDKPPQTTHIVFVVHGIGQKMDQGRIIKNTAMMRDTARKVEEKNFSHHLNEHVEFLPVEWRSKLALDGDTVDSITPDKVRGLRDMLNSSAMDIMYYTSPLYRDELVKGLQQELNRLYTLFCSRNPEFDEKGGKVSIVSHSLGCVITYDIMTGWNPVRLYEQLLRKDDEEREEHWMTYEEQHLLQELLLTKQRLRELEERMHGLKASNISKMPALKFKVENFFCMGSPLAVFLALRGIRPGNHGNQEHFLPKTICNRLFNIFHPTDPVAYRLEPLILKHYINISPVQIHWYNTANPTPYRLMKPCFLSTFKETTSASDTESIPSPSTSPVLSRRHYGESITNIGKAGILVELEHRIDFELREGLVESRYWSAVTSHTAYWSSMDIALFLLTFLYKQDSLEDEEQNSEEL